MKTKSNFNLYIDIDSYLHQLDARIKLPAALSLIILISALAQGTWPVLLFVFFMILGLQIASEISFPILFGRSLIVIPFLLAALPLLFTQNGENLYQFNLFNHLWGVSAAGLERFTHIFLKSWLSVQVAILLAATTQMMDLLNAMRVYRVPKMIVMVFRLMWRYLSIMITKARRMMRARDARSVNTNGHHDRILKHIAWQAKVTGSMAGSLLVRSLEQSERVYQAMLSRGFDGEIRLLPQPTLTRQQKTSLIGWLIFCLLLLWFSLLFG